MISRRAIVLSLLTYPTVVAAARNLQESDEGPEPLDYPPFEAITNPKSFAYKQATEKQEEKAREIINGTPFGPKPIDLAQSFVDRFYKNEPKLISQWPIPEEWNPLIVKFFSATSDPVNNDMTPWCAAFVNWCLERSGRDGSRNASSQSFLTTDFKQVREPQAGDLAIFTCYDKLTNRDLGIGHVAFFKAKLEPKKIRVVGGNQNTGGNYSIISETEYITTDREVVRRIKGEKVHCIRKLNSYIRIV